MNCKSNVQSEGAPDEGWFRCIILADSLVDSRHAVELEPLHGTMENVLSSTFRLGMIGIIR